MQPPVLALNIDGDGYKVFMEDLKINVFNKYH